MSKPYKYPLVNGDALMRKICPCCISTVPDNRMYCHVCGAYLGNGRRKEK
jgi:hypothetical protein